MSFDVRFGIDTVATLSQRSAAPAGVVITLFPIHVRASTPAVIYRGRTEAPFVAGHGVVRENGSSG
jgi:hypothetical protein